MMERLRHGERQPLVEIGLRSAGLSLFTLCALLWRALCRLINQPPSQHPATPIEFAMAAAAWMCLSLGLALTIEGAALFRLMPLSPRVPF